jgi:hypothetical protein
VLADSTFLKLNLGGFLTAARYSEILIVLVFSYYLKQHMNINKAFLASLGVFLAAFALILVPTMAHLGVNLGKHVWNPYFVYTRQVEGYDFIERVQAFNMLAWFPTSLLKLMIYNFMGSFVLSKLYRTKSHKAFVLPLSLICAVICLIPMLSKPSTVEYCVRIKGFRSWLARLSGFCRSSPYWYMPSDAANSPIALRN